MIEHGIPSSWRFVELKNIATFVSGGTPSRKKSDYFTGTTPWLTGSDLPEDQVAFVDEAREYITDEAIEKSATNIVPPETILLTTRVTIGKVAIAQESLCFSQDITGIILDDADIIDPVYFAHFLLATRQAFLFRSRGTTIQGIIRKDLVRFQIPLPPISEQRRIAEILSRANDLLRLRREANAQMADLSTALFWEMFGDPVSNSKEWKTKPLAKVGKLDRGRSRYRPRNAPHLYGGPYPFLQTGDIAASNGWITEYNQTYSEEGLSQSYLWRKGTLCITIAANIAETGILTFDACFPDSVVGFVPSSQVRVEYVRQWFEAIQGRLETIAPQAAQKNINLRILRELLIPTPPIELQDLFAAKILKIRSMIDDQERTSIKLTYLFDALLANTFTGELTDAWREKHIEQLQEENAQRDKALGLRPRGREKDYVAELDTPAGRAVFEQEVQERLRSTAEKLVEVVTPQVRLGDILEIEPLEDLNQLLTPVLNAYRDTVNASLLRSVELLNKETQKTLAKGVNTMLRTLAQSTLEAHQQQIVDLARTITQNAALITLRPGEEHPRYHSLQALSDEQYGVYLKALQSDGHFTAENLLEKDGPSIEHVRRTLSLLDALGLVVCVQVPSDGSGQSLFYIRAYHTTASVDERDDTLAELKEAFPELPA